MSAMNDHLPVISGAHKKDDFLPLYFYELTPKLKQQAKDELYEDEDTIQSSLDELRDLIRKNWDLSKVKPADILKTVVVCLMDVLYCPISQIAGTNLIVDCTNMTLRHLLSFRPRHVKFISDCIQTTSPFRFKETHFLNHGQVVYSFWYLLKPLLSQKYVKRVHFHGNDIKSLHRFVQPSVLPEELGGVLGPLDNTRYIECLLESKDMITKNIEMFRMKMCD